MSALGQVIFIAAWARTNNHAVKPALLEEARYKLFHPLSEKFIVCDLENAVAEPSLLHFPERSDAALAEVESINLEIDDTALSKLSSERVLALSLAEMKAVQFHFGEGNRGHGLHKARHDSGLADNLTDVELEIIAQTWSEHCKHKIFGAHIDHEEYEAGSETPTNVVEIDSLYKTYIQAPTHELMKKRDDLLSVFEDNSGVVKWERRASCLFQSPKRTIRPRPSNHTVAPSLASSASTAIFSVPALVPDQFLTPMYFVLPILPPNWLTVQNYCRPKQS